MKVQIIVGRLLNGSSSKSAPTVEKPVYTAPPAAPKVIDAATQEAAMTPEEEEKRVKDATKEGAKSLQIPVTTTAGTTSSTVGTGQ